MEKLKADIKSFEEKLPPDIGANISEEQLKECSKYPFSLFSNKMSFLIGSGILHYDDFVQIRDEYYRRNPNLDFFEIAPRTFGQTWGEKHLRSLHQTLITPTRETDSNFDGEYDLWLPLENNGGIKIEVKASHVVKNTSGGALVAKGYKWVENVNELPFKMNFQQLKPHCCDVFVWIAVWLDKIDYWVIPSNKIIMRPKREKKRKKLVNQQGYLHMSPQHRGSKKEGQIIVTNKHYNDIDKYKVEAEQILNKIKGYGKVNQRT